MLSNVNFMVILHGKDTRALTFENYNLSVLNSVVIGPLKHVPDSIRSYVVRV
jgi:hypothetical protein